MNLDKYINALIDNNNDYHRFINFDKSEKLLEGGIAEVAVNNDSISFFALMEDSDVFSKAKGRYDYTWELGDVMEVFLIADCNKKEYFEFHIAPSNATLELKIPNVEDLLADKYPTTHYFYNSNITTENGTFNQSNISGWWGKINVPFETIGFNGDFTSFRYSICRYNYNKIWNKPEMSSIVKHKTSSFHEPTAWIKV